MRGHATCAFLLFLLSISGGECRLSAHGKVKNGKLVCIEAQIDGESSSDGVTNRDQVCCVRSCRACASGRVGVCLFVPLQLLSGISKRQNGRRGITYRPASGFDELEQMT